MAYRPPRTLAERTPFTSRMCQTCAAYPRALGASA